MGDCSCIYLDVENGPEFCDVTTPTARGIHRCCECGREIEPGEMYERASGKWDQEITTYKTCLDCVSAREQFFCDGYFYGQIWSDVWEHIVEMRGKISSDCILSLTPVARGMLLDKIQEYWNELDDEEGSEGSP